MATAKKQTQGFKIVVHKSMGNATTAVSIIYLVYGLYTTNLQQQIHFGKNVMLLKLHFLLTQ